MTDPTGTTTPHTGLVVEPYRDDHNRPRWVFRCWGTDTCDGLLSLDHDTRGSAESARDRHVAEEHAADEDDAPQPGESLVPRVLLDHIERHDAEEHETAARLAGFDQYDDYRGGAPRPAPAPATAEELGWLSVAAHVAQTHPARAQCKCPAELCRCGHHAAPAPSAGALRDQLAEALRNRIRRAAVPGMRPAGGGAIGNLMGATEYDLADAVLATPELAQRLAHLADYENRITWETTCGEHARLLDSCYAETVRAEKAEAGRAEAEAQAELTRGELVNTLRELAELRRVSALHADTERRLKAELAAEVRKREAAEAEIQRMLRESPWLRASDEEREDAQAALASVREYVLNLDQMAESTTSPHDRSLYRALAGDLRKRLGYEAADTPEETP